MHWTLDVVFKDDQCRLRKGHGAVNMAIVRAANDRHSLKARHKKANLNPDYLETLIRQKPALT